MTLVSAFLHNKVLTHESSLSAAVARLRNIDPLKDSGEEISNYLQREPVWSALKASTHADRIAKAYTLFALDKDVLQAQLTTEAEKLATSLWSTIVPHLRILYRHGQDYGISTGDPEQVWMDEFVPDITFVLQRSLYHATRLDVMGCEYSYYWPTLDEEFDPHTMRIDRNMSSRPHMRQTVLFTVFPGLEVIAPDASRQKMYVPAVVKLHQRVE
jgi:hypothetical protein